MKKFIYLLIPALTILFFFACSTIEKVTGGGALGRIVIYTSMYDEVVEAMERELKMQFPHARIEFVAGGSGRIEAMIAAQKATGKLGCDILMVADPSFSLELKEMGMLHSFMSPEAKNLAFDYDPNGYWYPVRVSNMVLAYNPEINARNTIPNSFYDFAHDERVRGAISMRNPLASGTTMATVAALRDKYGYEYLEALGRQNIAIDSSVVALQKLKAGDYKVVMVLEESILKIRAEERSSLDVIYPTDGTVVIPSNIMIINRKWSANRNTATAEAITNWFLSPDGQSAIVAGWMHSVRANFNKLPYNALHTKEIMANSIHVNWETLSRNRQDLQYRFEDYVITKRQ